MVACLFVCYYNLFTFTVWKPNDECCARKHTHKSCSLSLSLSLSVRLCGQSCELLHAVSAVFSLRFAAFKFAFWPDFFPPIATRQSAAQPASQPDAATLSSPPLIRFNIYSFQQSDNNKHTLEGYEIAQALLSLPILH